MVPGRASEFSTLDTLRRHQSNHFIPWSSFAKSQSHTLWSWAILECGTRLFQRRRRSWCHSKGPDRAWDLAWLHLECFCPSKDQRFAKEGLYFLDCSLCFWKGLLSFLWFLGSFALVAFLTLVLFGIYIASCACGLYALIFVPFSTLLAFWPCLACKKEPQQTQHPTIQQPGHTVPGNTSWNTKHNSGIVLDLIAGSSSPSKAFCLIGITKWAGNLLRCRSETHVAWFLAKPHRSLVTFFNHYSCSLGWTNVIFASFDSCFETLGNGAFALIPRSVDLLLLVMIITKMPMTKTPTRMTA